ncbi:MULTISPECIES: helix-turn-helix transcriptional regulator [Rahnella]|jgi:predicted ArsR family transcriptional regulator|uniref:Transcriptional regulator n=1 Tax=Rahnella contaminans TaxID=2703882 RepID=A0A6M2B638_9GAMM|nr:MULTISPECIES: metalloregulator ArsR/SmtB family transcription factor [Rahnella]MCS3422053.1 putative ArsR family transcriptional regulator [Rahnella sp. BIGb0603]NGX88133.1 transcriptional regulator [Rahnella contaminans]
MSSNDLENKNDVRQSVAERLMTLLKTRGEMQASDAGHLLGTTGEAARQQFVKLAKDGLAEAKAVSQGVGRPAQYWQLTAKGHAHFPDAHADLTVQLLQLIRTSLGESALDQLITSRESQTLDNYRQAMKGANSLEERLQRLTAIRTREGYMADWTLQKDGSYLFVENHCPICAAATTCQGFCRAERDVFRDVLEANVERTEHILQGARRCAYVIR